jgi:hypothetical protein
MLLTTGLPHGYRGYMSRSAEGVGMDLTLVGPFHACTTLIAIAPLRNLRALHAHVRKQIEFGVAAAEG